MNYDFSRIPNFPTNNDNSKENLERINNLLAEVDQAISASSQAAGIEEEKRAAEARSGRLGHSWQAIQQRIDLNQTTLEDIFSGVDQSKDAIAIRDQAQENAARFREAIIEQAESEDEPSPFDELASAQNGLADSLRLISEQLDKVRHRDSR